MTSSAGSGYSVPQGAMTKADLIDLIAERAKLPHGRAELLICQMFDSMVDALCRGEGIEIRGFGSFSIRSYKEYQGRNPRTGEAVRVRPKRLAFFKVGKELRERVNSNAGNGVPDSDDDGPDADSSDL
ncbi:MAG TPA: HU family DNA-binding protein [Polyangia bacterium]